MARKFAVLLVCLALAVGSGECTWGASLFREFAPAFAARPPETAICSANWRRVWWGGLFCGAPVCRHRPPTGRPTPPSPAAAQAGGWGKPKPKPKVPHTVAELREWGREWEVSATRQAAHAVRGFRAYCKPLCPVHEPWWQPPHLVCASSVIDRTPLFVFSCCSGDREGAGV